MITPQASPMTPSTSAQPAPPTPTDSEDTLPETPVEAAVRPAEEYSSRTPLHAAGPLPRKRGEIGYQEVQAQGEGSGSAGEGAEVAERHPADRESPPPSIPAPVPPVSHARSEVPASPAIIKPSKGGRTFAGIHSSTLFVFVTELVLLVGTIVGWALAGVGLSKMSKNASQSSSSDSSGMEMESSLVFVHIIFAAVVLVELVMLERHLFRMRAERYAFLHPGELRSPTTGAGGSMRLAPWLRPPLPTYAAALAQGGGQGTGDVEDGLIAVPPPPAYGHTRGSVLLLAGFLRESLRAARPPTVMSDMSEAGGAGGGERPKSYVSRDEEWEVICDAERAQTLEETLAKLEDGTVVDQEGEADSAQDLAWP